MTQPAVTLFIDPPSHHFLEDRFFDTTAAGGLGDNLLAPYAYLRDRLQSRGIPVYTADRLLRDNRVASRSLYVSMGILSNCRTLARRKDVVLSGLFVMECPIVEPKLYRRLKRAQAGFKRVFSWSDSQSLERFVGAPLQCEHFYWPQSYDAVHKEIWERSDRKLLVMINGNKLPRLYWQELYTERMRAVEFFSRTGDIDLYGTGWDGPSRRMGATIVPWRIRRLQETLVAQWQKVQPKPLLKAARAVYRGRAASKIDTLGRYTFALCFENMILKGWITEKIFDCFFAGTVPIYWGAPNITDHIPAECFIDMRRFSNYQDLREYLKSLDENAVRRYKENARDFLASARFKPFSKEAFAAIFCRILREDAGVVV